MILNQQNKAAVDLAGARSFVTKLGSVLGLGKRDFNICFVDDGGIARLNGQFRGKSYPTDVLSFPWNAASGAQTGSPTPSWQGKAKPNGSSPSEFCDFLGDIVISVESAGRNASAEGLSLQLELNWLILHGLLHLLGMDHETDHGEMAALERDLRKRLGVGNSGDGPGKPLRQKKGAPGGGPKRTSKRRRR